MKRNLLLTILLSIVISGNAQWKVTSVDNFSNKDNELLQIVETEQSVLIYGVFDRKVDEATYYSIPRKTKVEVNGESYKIKNSANIPIFDDGEKKWTILDSENHKVNYLLEFEKFPVADGFSIISENTDEASMDVNSSGIHIEKIDSADIIEPDSFIKGETPFIVCNFTKNGRDFVYYIKQNVFITFHIERLDKDILYFIDIANKSDHDVNFELESTSVTAYKEKGEGNKEEFFLVRYTPEKYEKEFKIRDYWAADSVAGGLNYVASAVETVDLAGKLTKTYSGAGLSAISLGTRILAEHNIKKYMEEHPRSHPTALRSKDIKPGESYNGFVAFKYKKSISQIFHLKIEGKDCTMNSAFLK